MAGDVGLYRPKRFLENICDGNDNDNDNSNEVDPRNALLDSISIYYLLVDSPLPLHPLYNGNAQSEPFPRLVDRLFYYLLI